MVKRRYKNMNVLAHGSGRVLRRRGFNLLEVTISTLLVGILLVGSMNTTGSLIRRHGVRAQSDVKLALAHDLLSEVQQAAFEDPEGGMGFGVDWGESSGERSDFDDVDDYHKWNESAIEDRSGQALSGYAGYSRSVTVEPVRIDDPSVVSSSSMDLKRITVSVKGPDGAIQTMVALRSRFGPIDVEPGVLSSYVRSIHVRLELDDASSPLDSGTAILNQVANEEMP